MPSLPRKIARVRVSSPEPRKTNSSPRENTADDLTFIFHCGFNAAKAKVFTSSPSSWSCCWCPVRFDGSRFLLLLAYPREFAKEAIENRWIVTDDKPKNRYHRCKPKILVLGRFREPVLWRC